MQARLIPSVLGLVVTSCDSLLTRHKELEYVWKRPLQLTFVRCLFILARYLALLIHIGNIVLASILSIRFLGHQQPTDDACIIWFNFQTASCYSMVLILELILSIRVFALYKQSLKMGLFLLIMLAGRMAGSIYMTVIWNQVHIQQFKFTKNCVSIVSVAERPIRNPTVAFIIGEIFIHLVIHGLAWKRTIWDLRTFARPPLFSVLNRDGLKVFAAVSFGVVSIGVCAGNKAIPVLLVYPLFISLVSTAGCRTILNLQTLNVTTRRETPSSEQNNELELTSINDISTWDARSRLEGTCL
ncbi:hypothetical protein BT96DRAFT_923756 [Gymnopus androsaceus JB14]|uniref:DUF6533 domain-containing protein n=1 Tax=Gymnopus androsaceus JB14 TaxID=1447944 RepID=A0A6A4H9J2_9AGAR|nr:hypothetical protein BT96DRAFT_923756 [Gymnopus androsaceus JB14]